MMNKYTVVGYYVEAGRRPTGGEWGVVCHVEAESPLNAKMAAVRQIAFVNYGDNMLGLDDANAAIRAVRDTFRLAAVFAEHIVPEEVEAFVVHRYPE